VTPGVERAGPLNLEQASSGVTVLDGPGHLSVHSPGRGPPYSEPSVDIEITVKRRRK
jgi:hypothetical protein